MMNKIVVLVAGLALSFGASADNWNNSPKNWNNSPKNWNNSPKNWNNSPKNWENNPNNYNRNNGIQGLDGSIGYYTIKPDGGVNIYDDDGNWQGFSNK